MEELPFPDPGERVRNKIRDLDSSFLSAKGVQLQLYQIYLDSKRNASLGFYKRLKDIKNAKTDNTFPKEEQRKGHTEA